MSIQLTTPAEGSRPQNRLFQVVRAGESGTDADTLAAPALVTFDPGGSPYRRYLPADEVRPGKENGSKKCFNATET